MCEGKSHPPRPKRHPLWSSLMLRFMPLGRPSQGRSNRGTSHGLQRQCASLIVACILYICAMRIALHALGAMGAFKAPLSSPLQMCVGALTRFITSRASSRCKSGACATDTHGGLAPRADRAPLSHRRLAWNSSRGRAEAAALGPPGGRSRHRRLLGALAADGAIRPPLRAPASLV